MAFDLTTTLASYVGLAPPAKSKGAPGVVHEAMLDTGCTLSMMDDVYATTFLPDLEWETGENGCVDCVGLGQPVTTSGRTTLTITFFSASEGMCKIDHTFYRIPIRAHPVIIGLHALRPLGASLHLTTPSISFAWLDPDVHYLCHWKPRSRMTPPGILSQETSEPATFAV